jgi:flagellar biosynthesis chaperone FliJ
MNKRRRMAIYDVVNRLFILKKNGVTKSDLEAVYQDIDYILDEEESYMNNIPENMQSGYRYEKAEEACDNLQEAKDNIYDAKENCRSAEEIICFIEDAAQHLRNAAL